SDADLAGNVSAMTEALRSVRTVEITHADKDVCVEGVTVGRGHIIGLVDDKLVAGGNDVAAVTFEALVLANLESAELVTIFSGEAARTSEIEQICSHIAREHDGVAVEVYDGGQPHYLYVIAVE
ncbi:MAG: DAK2 domain-containing protein, partial [Thermomicrobiales bacterium]